MENHQRFRWGKDIMQAKRENEEERIRKAEELEKLVSSIDKRLDKFEGKWPKLILWAEEKYGPASETPAQEEEIGHGEGLESPGIEQTLELIISGNSEEALSNLKKMVSTNPSDPDVWNAFSSYFSSTGKSGRANACEKKAQSLG